MTLRAEVTCSPNWRKNISGNAHLSISMGTKNHSTNALSAMVDWINNKTDFTHVRIGLSDVLQRHNHMAQENCSYLSAYEKTLRHGNVWLEKNMHVIKQLKIPFEIKRWDFWLNAHRVEVEKNIRFFENLYNNDKIFSNAVNLDIHEYLVRKGISLENIPCIRACKNYLLEELAVYTIIFGEYNPCSMIYPGKELHSMKVIRSGEVQAIPETIDSSFYIRLAIRGWSTLEISERQAA